MDGPAALNTENKIKKYMLDVYISNIHSVRYQIQSAYPRTMLTTAHKKHHIIRDYEHSYYAQVIV